MSVWEPTSYRKRAGLYSLIVSEDEKGWRWAIYKRHENSPSPNFSSSFDFVKAGVETTMTAAQEKADAYIKETK